MSPGETNEASLLWTLEEVGRLVSQSGNSAETLANVVLLIQQRFQTDVCSVYLLEPDRASLVLAATIGLRPESVGRIRMRLTEGLVGLVAERVQAQNVPDATTHPRFKYFPEAGEEPYRSFLGVPILDHGVLQGVLVVQTLDPRVYSADDARMLMVELGLSRMPTRSRRTWPSSSTRKPRTSRPSPRGVQPPRTS